ncbi:NAD-dependent epimerase/dehydratase family protein [bacterium]|nr:NAD-dependent epimerase/dehydratase family protein [bacterium]
MKRILVIGALGQIGSELTPALRERYGADNVIAGDIREPRATDARDAGPFIKCNVTRREQIDDAIERFKVDTVVNLAAILSARCEKAPQLCWQVNVAGLINVLEAAREHELTQVFCPSSIAVFGPSTQRHNTPQATVLEPTTIYGVTKATGEMLCRYYFETHGVDARGLRYPGIISSGTMPSGGTTDYAVAMFYKAVEVESYICYVREDTRLPMMYMPDCIKATLDLMAAPSPGLTCRSSYNVAAMSFSAGELAAGIKARIPGFECAYEPDERQGYADSWPQSMDDSAARKDWGWQPSYDLETMVEDMLKSLNVRHEHGHLYIAAAG